MKTIFFALALGWASFLQAKTFTYFLGDTPYKDISVCMKEAEVLAKKITQQTQVATFNARCDWNEYSPTLSLAIDYTADQPLSFTSTSPDSVKGERRGFYASLETCEADRAAQETLFKSETALSILTSFCYIDRLSQSYPYNIRIEAVGSSKRQPYYLSLFSDSGIHSPKPQVVAAYARSYFAARGANLVHLAFRTAMPVNQIVFFYYADREWALSQEVLYHFPGLEACESELKFITAKLEQAEIHLPVAYCGSPFSPASSLDLYLAWEPHLFKLKKSLEKYKDYKTCMANRDALVEKYQGALGAKLLTGTCQRDLSTLEYRVTLFIKN